MSNYYKDTLEQIQKCIDENKIEEAMQLVNQELAISYIPIDIEKQLRDYKRELQYLSAEKKKNVEYSLDELLDYLQGKPEEQLAACAMLAKRNLRECLPEIQTYLAGNPCKEAAALLVETIAEQGIGEEFTWTKDDVEYTFFGDSVTPVAESEGFIEANNLLKEWLSNDNPDLYEFSKAVLAQEGYLFLPLNYDAGEGYTLAIDVLKKVSDMMDDGKIYEEILQRNNPSNMN